MSKIPASLDIINAFFTISYIPFLLPKMLYGTGFNAELLWTTICTLIAVCSIIATYFSQRALIAGPSIAAIAVLMDRVYPSINSNSELAAIILTTSVLLALSAQFNLHNKLLRILSNKTKIGFKAGIGLMFLITSLSMVHASNTLLFFALFSVFIILRNYSFIPPLICIATTIALNLETSSAIHQLKPMLFMPSWHNSLIASIIVLYSTMLIDTTITANTLNPGKEHKGLNLTAVFSGISSCSTLLPCSMYLETLILPNKNDIKAAYYCAFIFMLFGILGRNLFIPDYLAAALLASLGIKIFISTKPQIWLRKSPQAIIVALFVGLIKSFLIAITAGIALDTIKNKLTLENTIWLIMLTFVIVLVHH